MSGKRGAALGPGRGEQFFLYILLKNRPARSYEDLKTVDGVVHDKFRDAVRALGLMRDDNEYVLCIEQAMRELGWTGEWDDPAREACGPVLRSLFVTLMQQGADWEALMKSTGDALLDDFLSETKGDRDASTELLRADIARRLRLNGKRPDKDYK